MFQISLNDVAAFVKKAGLVQQTKECLNWQTKYYIIPSSTNIVFIFAVCALSTESNDQKLTHWQIKRDKKCIIIISEFGEDKEKCTLQFTIGLKNNQCGTYKRTDSELE